MRYETIAIAAIVLLAPGSQTSAAPRARKGVSTTKRARPATRSTSAKPKAAKSKKKKRKHIGKRLRKGSLPPGSFKVRHAPIVAPSRTLVGSKRARSPLNFRSMKKPAKVEFTPCSASLPAQAPMPKRLRPGMDAAISEGSYRWPNGSTLRVGFLDGSEEARKAVAEVASEWTEHANLTFDFSFGAPPARADILIVFDADPCNSNLGTSSRYHTERGESSMRLCHLDQRIGSDTFKRVVLHEFGHALSLHHEHQSPKMNVRWNKDYVYSYYEATQGWNAEFVDMWVFDRISPAIADSSDYDRDSVMHYSFPAEFTVDGVAFGGKKALSPVDKSFIAEVYPGRKVPKPKRRYERKIAVRNQTGQALDIQSIYETKSGKKAKWAPKKSLADAPVVRVPAGEERRLDGVGRRLKLVARSTDGKSTWGAWQKTPLRIAPKDGYLDGEVQTYVVVIDGPPDPPPQQSKEELYGSAAKALEQGRHEDARALFTTFIERFDGDRLVPWAQFNIVVSWYEDGRAEQALEEGYALIIDHPDADPTPYAWFYGGLSALGTGWCDGATAYFDYASEERSGLPKKWRTVANDYLALIEKHPRRYCW